MYSGITYNEFMDLLPSLVLQHFPCNTVRTLERYGVNDVRKDQLLIAKGNQELSVAIPVKELYESYQKGLVGRIYNEVEDALRVMEKNHEVIVGEVKELCYEKARAKLRLSLCNYAWSRKYLESVLYFRWLDLAIVVYLEMEHGVEHSPVSAEMLQAWKVTPECVYQDAVWNMREREYTFCSLYEQFVKMGVSELIQLGEAQYILSSKQLEHGAVYMAVPGILKKCAVKLGAKQMVLFPSSIHEVLIVPVGKVTVEENKQFRELVTEINEDAVLEEERLADHAYIYKREEDRVYML